MVEDFVVEGSHVDLVEVGGAITIFGMAEERRRGKEEAGSSTRRRLRLRSGSSFGRNDSIEKEARVEFELSPKELGEIAEAEFLRTVLRKRIAVSKPWGENRGYDFILDDEGRLNRVQVKAAFRGEQERGYSLRTYRSSKRCYTAKDIDVLVGYVDPGRVWYLFPVRVIKKLRSLKLFPGSKGKRSKHEKWREAWWVVKR